MRKRIVIYYIGSLGDTIVALPCFHKIAETFADAQRIVLTSKPASANTVAMDDLLAGSGLIDSVVTYPDKTRSIFALFRLAFKLRALKADTLIYLSRARGMAACQRDLLFFRLCGFRKIIGAPNAPDFQHYTPDEHGNIERECERLARRLTPLGKIDVYDRNVWDLRLSSTEHAAGRSCTAPFGSAPFFAIHMGCKRPRNDWGTANWQELIVRLRTIMPQYGLLCIGGPPDRAHAQDVTACWNGPVVNACGTLSSRISGAALANARLFIGHDSGPIHLAAAMGVPCVGIFGDHNRPRKWHPPGPQHRILHSMRGVAAITVDEVEAAVRSVLSADTAP